MPSDAISETAGAQPLRPIVSACDEPAVTRSLSQWLEQRAMFIIAVSAVLIISLLGIPKHLSQDGWLALISGRLIATHGIPHQDFFAYLTHGVRWVDQQWLAQLLMYEVQRVGGLGLLCVVYVLVTVAAFGGAVAAARRLGGEDLHVLMTTLPGAFFYLVTALSIRTQGLAYPLFVATLWLLGSELHAQQRSLRVYLVLPMLVLWGNLHGSVTLGVGIAGLYGLVQLARSVGERGAGGLLNWHAITFVLAPPLTLIATPYGTGMIHYFRVTLLNPQFSRMVTEWKPVMTVPILAIPLLATIVVTGLVLARVYLQARRGLAARPGLFELVILATLGAGAIIAVRNITWFGLALMILLPGAITELKGAAPLSRSRANRRIAAASIALAGLVTVLVLARPTDWFTSSYPSKAIPTLRALVRADPRARILADVRYADWLIWRDPGLFSGRIAYDTSFELLNESQLSAIADLAARTPDARHLLSEFRIWMLYPGNRTVNRTLLRRPGVRLVSRNHLAIIALNNDTSRA